MGAPEEGAESDRPPSSAPDVEAPVWVEARCIAGLTVREVVRLLERRGRKVEARPPDLLVVDGPDRDYVVHLGGRPADDGGYEWMTFAARWSDAPTTARLETLNRTARGWRVTREIDGQLRLTMDVLVRGGAPTAQLEAWVDTWERAVREVQGEQSRSGRG